MSRAILADARPESTDEIVILGVGVQRSRAAHTARPLGWVINVACLVATGVNADGTGRSWAWMCSVKSHAGWLTFFRGTDRAAFIRLVGAVLAEQHDEWAEGRRYLGLDIIAKPALQDH